MTLSLAARADRLLLILLAAWVASTAAAFLAGRATQRYDTLMASPAVCGDSLHPAGIHRAPLYRPRGPVPK